MKLTEWLLIVLFAISVTGAHAQATPAKDSTKPAAKASDKGGIGDAAKSVAAKATGATDPIDINSATAKQLDALPGIGKAYSAKIIANRPYKGKDELVSKKVIPQGVYAKIKDSIIAKQ